MDYRKSLYHIPPGNNNNADRHADKDLYALKELLEDPLLQIQVLETKLDEHKEALREIIAQKTQLLGERDNTIKTLCLHNFSLYQTISQITEEKEHLQEINNELSRQLECLSGTTWQYSGDNVKKRKRGPFEDGRTPSEAPSET